MCNTIHNNCEKRIWMKVFLSIEKNHIKYLLKKKEIVFLTRFVLNGYSPSVSKGKVNVFDIQKLKYFSVFG